MIVYSNFECSQATRGLTRARIDEKNVTTDWVEDVFDTCVRHGDLIVGIIDGEAVVCEFDRTSIWWRVPLTDHVCDKLEKILDVLTERLEAYDTKEGNLMSVLWLGHSDILQTFYFKQNELF